MTVGDEVFTGFTPVPDCIRAELGPIPANVFGVVWRFTRQQRGACDARLENIATRAGYGTTATRASLRILAANGWIIEETRQGKPTIYRDAGRWTLCVVGEDTAAAASTPTPRVVLVAEPQRVALPTPTRGVALTPTRGVAKDSKVFKETSKKEMPAPVAASGAGAPFNLDAPVHDTTGNVNGTSTASQITDTSKPEPTKAHSAAARQPRAKKESVPLTPAELDLRDAILDACGWSWDVLARNDRINTVGLARKLARAGRERADVVAGASHFARNDWRGKRHEKPGIAALETSIGAAAKEASPAAAVPPSTRWAHAFDPPPVFAADDGWGVVGVAP